MNVKFADKLSATVFHNCLHHEQHKTSDGAACLTQFILSKFSGGWCDQPNDFPVPPVVDYTSPEVRDPAHRFSQLSQDRLADKTMRVHAHELWRHQGGRMATLIIGVATGDIYWAAGDPHAWEFSWQIVAAPVNEYGEPDPKRVPAPKPERWVSGVGEVVMNGGLVNHGTHEEPDWHSHT
jgi:hypothetical protein